MSRDVNKHPRGTCDVSLRRPAIDQRGAKRSYRIAEIRFRQHGGDQADLSTSLIPVIRRLPA
ncbi:MAG TPA: hypothetical protein PKD64_07865 [Pirellulaceae bacterium]|nr:hypothetical protein [Pirellulaceae bacterium]HMP69308.1 hypothetical protein [Pirellulaceae bacterium]